MHGGTGIVPVGIMAAARPQTSAVSYANDVVKAGVVASMFWGIAGMTVGFIIALQLSFPSLFYFPDLAVDEFRAACVRCIPRP